MLSRRACQCPFALSCHFEARFLRREISLTWSRDFSLRSK